MGNFEENEAGEQRTRFECPLGYTSEAACLCSGRGGTTRMNLSDPCPFAVLRQTVPLGNGFGAAVRCTYPVPAFQTGAARL